MGIFRSLWRGLGGQRKRAVQKPVDRIALMADDPYYFVEVVRKMHKDHEAEIGVVDLDEWAAMTISRHKQRRNQSDL